MDEIESAILGRSSYLLQFKDGNNMNIDYQGNVYQLVCMIRDYAEEYNINVVEMC